MALSFQLEITVLPFFTDSFCSKLTTFSFTMLRLQTDNGYIAPNDPPESPESLTE